MYDPNSFIVTYTSESKTIQFRQTNDKISFTLIICNYQKASVLNNVLNLFFKGSLEPYVLTFSNSSNANLAFEKLTTAIDTLLPNCNKGGVFNIKGEFNDNSAAINGGLEIGDTYSIPLSGNRALLAIVKTEPVLVPFNFSYGVTDAVTTGVPLTEVEYLTAVDNVFIAGNEINAVAANHGNNVTVQNFGNSSNKVVFIRVSQTEQPFTKWSEVGNDFQQNQPIDPNFFGSNVFFKSTHDGESIYIVRMQTSFSGAIILSR